MTSPKISCLQRPPLERVSKLRVEAVCAMGLRTAKDQA